MSLQVKIGNLVNDCLKLAITEIAPRGNGQINSR